MYKQYQDENSVVVNFAIIRLIDGACIPFDPANTDYQEFLRWKEQGNEPLPPDA